MIDDHFIIDGFRVKSSVNKHGKVTNTFIGTSHTDTLDLANLAYADLSNTIKMANNIVHLLTEGRNHCRLQQQRHVKCRGRPKHQNAGNGKEDIVKAGDEAELLFIGHRALALRRHKGAKGGDIIGR